MQQHGFLLAHPGEPCVWQTPSLQNLQRRCVWGHPCQHSEWCLLLEANHVAAASQAKQCERQRGYGTGCEGQPGYTEGPREAGALLLHHLWKLV
jgi:hypothetical protein